MRFVIAPDSYKGSLTSKEVGEIMARAIRREMPEADITVIPMADGGEGTVEAIVAACKGKLVKTKINGPLMHEVPACYGLIREAEQQTAIIEAANTCGLTMVPPELRNPLTTTSRGLGQMMIHVLNQGCRQMIIGLGGSGTNDGGMGMLSALGVVFTDEFGKLLEGSGADLIRVSRVDWSGLDSRLADCSITIASDVTNPLTGTNGASFVFGPQKGASEEQVQELDTAMERYASLMEADSSQAQAAQGQRYSEQEGAGAAGGLGFALLRLGAHIESGAEIVAQATGIKELISEADYVLTGEGRSDAQTLFGKLPSRVAGWASAYGKPTILISGSLDTEIEQLYDCFAACFSIMNRPSSIDECMADAEMNLEVCTRNIVRLLPH